MIIKEPSFLSFNIKLSSLSFEIILPFFSIQYAFFVNLLLPMDLIGMISFFRNNDQLNPFIDFPVIIEIFISSIFL